MERQYLTSVDGFICNSRTTRAEVEALAGSNRPAVVAPPGGDHISGCLSREEVLSRAPAGDLRIIFVGNLIPRKGLHTLLTALASLPDQDWSLTVVGSPEMNPLYVRDIHAQIAALGLNGKVRLLGTVTGEELAGHLRQSQLLAVPSSYEGFGIVYLEARRFGLPVIAGDAGGVREIVSHGVNGFLVPPGEAAPLARCLSSLIRNRDLLVQMSLAALAAAACQPTWEAGAAAVREFLLGFANYEGCQGREVKP